MAAFTLAHTAAPSATRSNGPSPAPVRPTPPEACPAMSGQQVRKSEADRAFEAGVQWFLAVSRAA
ncbi:MAG: hypothetical protein JWO38_3359 [Gemmataceae bacterium]|nr:hypothetical protein [Gemmataceae bacterium]